MNLKKATASLILSVFTILSVSSNSNAGNGNHKNQKHSSGIIKVESKISGDSCLYLTLEERNLEKGIVKHENMPEIIMINFNGEYEFLWSLNNNEISQEHWERMKVLLNEINYAASKCNLYDSKITEVKQSDVYIQARYNRKYRKWLFIRQDLEEKAENLLSSILGV